MGWRAESCPALTEGGKVHVWKRQLTSEILSSALFKKNLQEPSDNAICIGSTNSILINIQDWIKALDGLLRLPLLPFQCLVGHPQSRLSHPNNRCLLAKFLECIFNTFTKSYIAEVDLQYQGNVLLSESRSLPAPRFHPLILNQLSPT